jgi:hypothetical protein
MGSERALKFSLSPDAKSSSGFLKLFVASKYIDLQWIVQKLSPFDPLFRDTRTAIISREQLPPTGDALTVTLTMRRRDP